MLCAVLGACAGSGSPQIPTRRQGCGDNASAGALFGTGLGLAPCSRSSHRRRADASTGQPLRDARLNLPLQAQQVYCLPSIGPLKLRLPSWCVPWHTW